VIRTTTVEPGLRPGNTEQLHFESRKTAFFTKCSEG
jgi:hypothetical protein